jgi:hypothetical protein
MDSYLVAPAASRRYLLKEMGLAYIINILALVLFAHLLLNWGFGVFWDTNLFGVWYLIFVFQNTRGVYYKTIILTQLYAITPNTSTRS